MDAKSGLENLILARDALTALNLRYFLMDGTLLGLVRDGCFIDGDYDIDIGVFAEDFTVLSFGLYTSLMRRNGFTYQFQGVWGKFFVASWHRRNVRIDLCFYFRRGEQRILYACDFATRQVIEFSYPARLIETIAPVDFYGETFMAPKHKEAVLSHEYGDWKIPRRDWNWTTSPLNITRRTKITKWGMVESRLSSRILGLSRRVMGRTSDLMRWTASTIGLGSA